MSAPDAAAVEAAVRAEDAAAVRELLADATEADRRALAKTLKPLLDGPKWEGETPAFAALAVGVAGGLAAAYGALSGCHGHKSRSPRQHHPLRCPRRHRELRESRSRPSSFCCLLS